MTSPDRERLWKKNIQAVEKSMCKAKEVGKGMVPMEWQDVLCVKNRRECGVSLQWREQRELSLELYINSQIENGLYIVLSIWTV